MEEVPLRQDAESPPVKPEDKKSGTATSSFVNKRTIVIAAIVILVLVIIVIVLGALLGAERAKREGHEEKAEGSKDSAVTTTSAPGPTTPGTEVWWNVRLPDNIVPVDYNVVLYIDLKKLEFYGDVAILVKVTKPTENVLVHVNKMNITSVSVEKGSSGDRLGIQRHFWFEKNQFYVIVMTSALEKGHQYTIKMKFGAMLGDGLAGLYKSTYKRKDGTEVTMAATQFQPTDARRTFPCFDEPALKATFTITLAHDPNMISISNMPIKEKETKDNWQLDHFEKTPIMPTYLLAFVVCDFASRTKTTKRGTKMTFYAPPDKVDQVEYAKENAVKMLDYMEDYFNIPYPLPKADMVALPDFSFSGMENWGIIMYREAALLYKPNASSEANKQRTSAVLSHELAHQWFGNLVTMAWWGELWLNEGFASFVEFYGVNETEPDWKMLDQFVVIDMMLAFTLDGLANSHPIKVPVNHPDEINEIFDSISYNKGSSIIRMLQFFLGKDVFKKGLTRYLNKYRYGNAVTDDLWNALEKESCVSQDKCKSVKQMMDTWTLQMGYPVLNIAKKSGNKYTVTQERFLYDRSANFTSKYKTKFNYKWVVPFTYITKANSQATSKPLNMTSVEIDWDGNDWLKGNAGQTGFYRVNYAQQQWDQLTKQLGADHKVFEVTDRAGLIDDAFNLARGGYIKYTVPLNITKHMKNEDEYVPWAAVENNIEFITSILPQSSPAYKYLEKYLQFQARTQYQKLGFDDSGSHLDMYKRSLVLSIVCSAGEPSCLKNASEYFNKWMEDPEKYPVPANFRSLVYSYGIRNGGVKEWDFAFEQFQKSSVASERKQFLLGLASASEPWLLSRYLEYSVTPEKIRTQDTTDVLTNVANYSPYGRQLTWQFIKLNWDFIMKKFGGGFFAIRNIILGVTKGFATEYELQDLRNFNKKHDAGSGARAQQQAEETVKANIQWRKDNEQDIRNWLKDFLEANNIPRN